MARRYEPSGVAELGVPLSATDGGGRCIRTFTLTTD